MKVKEDLKLETGFRFEKAIALFITKTKQKMKTIKNLALLFIATVIAMNVNAQAAKTTSKEATKAKTETKAPAKTESKSTTTKSATTVDAKKESKEPAKTEAKTTTKTEVKKETTTEKKPRDGRTKTGDPINHDKKGPKGETVYSGPKGGNYYLDKSDKKVYIK